MYIYIPHTYVYTVRAHLHTHTHVRIHVCKRIRMHSQTYHETTWFHSILFCVPMAPVTSQFQRIHLCSVKIATPMAWGGPCRPTTSTEDIWAWPVPVHDQDCPGTQRRNPQSCQFYINSQFNLTVILHHVVSVGFHVFCSSGLKNHQSVWLINLWLPSQKSLGARASEVKQLGMVEPNPMQLSWRDDNPFTQFWIPSLKPPAIQSTTILHGYNWRSGGTQQQLPEKVYTTHMPQIPREECGICSIGTFLWVVWSYFNHGASIETASRGFLLQLDPVLPRVNAWAGHAIACHRCTSDFHWFPGSFT